MVKTPIMPRIAAICGAIVVAGWISGCSLIAKQPVDCKTVALQAESGRVNSEIAAEMDTSLEKVTACRETEKTASLDDSASLP